MRKKYNTNQVLRVIDVNFNRCKEGIRVVEEVFRFIEPDTALRNKLRRLRHELDRLNLCEVFPDAILCRNIATDPQKEFDVLEAKRPSIKLLVWINAQRAKESLRVLEEFVKLTTRSSLAPLIKKIRFKLYNLEQDIFKKL